MKYLIGVVSFSFEVRFENNMCALFFLSATKFAKNVG